MRDRNILKCRKCGTGIFTEASERECYKCGYPMEFMGRKSDGHKNSKI